MDAGTIPSNISLFLILLICVALDVVDIIEIVKLRTTWKSVNSIDYNLFQTCIKNELFFKTTFSSFSLSAALLATLAILLLIFCPELFFKRLIKGFLNLIYYFYGLYMLAFSIYFASFWKDYTYICYVPGDYNKIFSLMNAFSIVGSIILSSLIIVGFNFYFTLYVYSSSINKSDDSVEYIRKLFWWAVFQGRGNRNNQNNNHNQNARNVSNIIRADNNSINNYQQDNIDDENQRLL